MTRIIFLLVLGAFNLTPFFVQPAAAGCTEESARGEPGIWKSKFQPDIERSEAVSKTELPGVLKERSGYAPT